MQTKNDLTHLHNDLISDLIAYLRDSNEISSKCASYLLNSSPRTPELYLLPKIHKNKKPVPGRPIVSANNSPTERISKLADFFLQPLVQTTKSYIKDTTDFINHIEAIPPLPPDSLICTIDVCSLYTNIPNSEGISACKKILDKHRRTTQCPSNKNIVHLLEHVLYMNNFDFNRNHYLQVGGTAMGTKVAPSFANIFMADFEETWVYSYPTQPLIWLRYIDDIFLVWDKGRDSLVEFLDHLNTCHHSIKFTSDISDTTINFLDTSVHIDDDRKLYTDLYCKPTDSHNYLLYDSAHPSHLKRSLPYSQLLRVRRICSKLTDFDRNSLMICKHFQRRNYPMEIIEEALIRTRRLNRDELLHPPIATTTRTTIFDNDTMFLVSNFNPETNHLRDIVDKTWPILGRTNTTDNLYSKKVTFGDRRNQNLKDLLVHAKIPSPPPDQATIDKRARNRKCIAHNCRYCPKLDRTGKITSPHTGKEHVIRSQITCNSNNLIYCIKCKQCQALYVGQTKNSIKERFKCHFYSITHPSLSDTTVGRHFSSDNHSKLDDVIITVLEFVKAPNGTPASQRLRDELERKWIHKLVSTAPFGLNSAD